MNVFADLHRQSYRDLAIVRNRFESLADALGGTCGPQRPAEIGILDVALTEAGQKDVLFEGLPVKATSLVGARKGRDTTLG